MANFVRASSLWLAALVVLLLGQHSSLAQEVRFAPVIGNDQYRTATLATPANDAGLVADAPGAAGSHRSEESRSGGAAGNFSGIYWSSRVGRTQCSRSDLSRRFRFVIRRRDYFVPIDADIQRNVDVPLQAIRVSDFTQPLAALPGRVKIVIPPGAPEECGDGARRASVPHSAAKRLDQTCTSSAASRRTGQSERIRRRRPRRSRRRQTQPSSCHHLLRQRRIRAAPAMDRAAFRPTHRQMQR